MAPSSAARQLLALVCAAAGLRAAAVPLGVYSRPDPPAATSFGFSSRTHWVNDDVPLRNPAPARAPVSASGAAVRAVLEVVVPTPSTTARVVCTVAAPGCATNLVPILDKDDDTPLVVVGTDDKSTGDDVAEGKDGMIAEDDAKSESNVFFVDEDSDDDAIVDTKTKKVKKMHTSRVPIILSYDGWKGKPEDDIPINPHRRTHHSTNYDPDHAHSQLTAPPVYRMRPRPVYETERTSDLPATLWDAPSGSESVLVHRQLKSSPIGNTLYPMAAPTYWRSSYEYGGSVWRPQSFSGGFRPAVHRQTVQPMWGSRLYGDWQPQVHSPQSRPASRVWCPQDSPTTTSTTTTRPVSGVKDKLDFGDNDDGGQKGSTEDDGVKVIGKVELVDFKK